MFGMTNVFRTLEELIDELSFVTWYSRGITASRPTSTHWLRLVSLSIF